MNNKGADQPAHPSSLIRAFVIYLLESTMYLDLPQAKFQFSTEQAGLNLTLSETPKTGFLAPWPIC